MKPPSKQEAPSFAALARTRTANFKAEPKNPELPEWARRNAPFPAFGGGFGVRLTFGPAWPAFGRAARSAAALEEWRVQRAISPSARQGGARALAPRLRQKQRTRRAS
jgi:hypothetical protein